MNSKNVGKFSIETKLIYENPEFVAGMFSELKILPVKCEMIFASVTTEYTAICSKFEEVRLGCVIPEYLLIVTVDKQGSNVFDVAKI